MDICGFLRYIILIIFIQKYSFQIISLGFWCTLDGVELFQLSIKIIKDRFPTLGHHVFLELTEVPVHFNKVGVLPHIPQWHGLKNLLVTEVQVDLLLLSEVRLRTPPLHDVLEPLSELQRVSPATGWLNEGGPIMNNFPKKGFLGIALAEF